MKDYYWEVLQAEFFNDKVGLTVGSGANLK